MNLSNKLKELRILAEKQLPNYFDNEYIQSIRPSTIIEMCNCIEEMKACLEKRKDDSLYGYYAIKTPEKELLEKWFGE